MRPPDLWRLWLKLAALLTYGATLDKTNIEDCATVLGENLLETFNRATRSQHIPEYYDGYVEVEQYDPRIELKKAKQHIEKYLARRAKFAYDAKLSLEARPLLEGTDLEVNNPDSKNFIRYMSAKSGGDGGILYRHDHSFNNRISLNATRNFSMHANANFYFLSTSSIASAVHIPTPIYDRDPELLNKIHWSDIDQVYRSNREGTRDLAFQLFCSESGFMRYFPAAPWYWDHETDRDVLDLFDCRNSEWYINGATCSKNVLIMLDMSGSMLGQRYEIAKQTTEAILETLSHNDYFNILPFAANPQFLDEECSKQHPMLQATMRNKKYLRALMNNITSEGKAEYDAAIEKAFATLKGLPRDIEWMHKDEVEQSGRNFTLEGKHTIEFPERLLIVTDEYMKAIRVFTFLIGEEAIDFEQVRNMACQNRGYMVHIQNMADVEEKIQNYIRVMSRPLGAHDKDIDEKSQVWSGVYRERLYLPRRERFADPAPLTNQSFAQMNRMAAKRKIHMKKAEARSRMFVTTVSYPVLLNKTFMGVAAVNIPLTELGQLAHPTEIGGNSYYFMLDYNGFIMFHPQLRPIDMRTKLHKQNYNNMELLELEVGQNGMMHNVVLNCDNSKPPTLDVLFASDMVDRVYPQTNTYYSECIKDSDFVLGRPITSIIAYFMRFTNKLLLSAKQLSLFPFFHQFINTAEAFTASFHTAHDGFPCTKETPFYYQQPDDETRSGDLVDGGRAEKPCINTKCAVRMQAHSVPNTNLIMVWITQTKDSMHCYESAHCPLNYPSPVPFIWKSTEHNTTESKCRHVRSDRPNRKKRCFPGMIDEKGMPCSPAAHLTTDATVMLFITLALGVVVEEVNLHKRIALKMLCCTGTRPNRLLFGFMLITGFMSFFLTDYAATALMLPFAHAVLEAKQHGKQSDYMTDATPGIIVLYLMFVWPRYNPWDVRTRTKGEGPEKLLTWSMLQHKLAWSLLFLVGCGFAISTAVKESGLSSQIEDLLKEELSGLDPLLLQLICLLIVVVLTEFVSNSSTASIFVPLFLGAAQSLKMHPYYLGIPAAIGPSLAFMLPMATPPNALVFETGEITFWEMVYSGGLLSVFCVGATMLNMNTWAYWWFNMDEHKWLERAPGNTTLQMPPTPSAHAMSLNGIE
ncbi:unnamed protein product, partial [Mesorhabditis spiculigera]